MKRQAASSDMTRQTPNRIVKATTDALWRRDQLQMRAAGAVLTALTGKPVRPTRSRAVKRATVRRRPGFRSILCAIDFSEASKTALRYADEMSRKKGASLTVLHAEDPLLVSAAAAALNDRNMTARTADALRDFVSTTIRPDSSRRRQIAIRVVVGKPADEIVKAATRLHCDLIVLGTHGLAAIDRILVGSTAMGVLQRARVPVLAVPRRAR
jgi:universal stress protein A